MTDAALNLYPVSLAGRTKVYFHLGRPCRVLDRDSDPNALVWIVYLDNPNLDALVPPGELVEA